MSVGKIMGEVLREQKKEKMIKEFEHTIALAELKALSKLSLEQELTDKQFGRMKELKKEVFGGD